MLAVTVLLIVLIGAINGFSWIILDQQTDDVLHTISSRDGKFLQGDLPERNPFSPPMDMDTVKSARFFTVLTNPNGVVLDVNIEQISSVTLEEAVQYAAQVTDGSGTIDCYKYHVKQLGTEKLIFFIDTSSQLRTFIMVLTISSALALVCWLLMFLFVILLSGRVVRPILANMEQQKQFITNAGHELKTPLAIIQSNNDAATLIHGETKYSRNIRLQTQRLNVLMTNLLTLTRLDEDTSLPTESVDISLLVQEILSGFEDACTQKQLQLTAEIAPRIFLEVHRDTFAQMISILLDNAVKYTPESGLIQLTVRPNGGQIEIVEENTCVRIPDFDPEQFFQRFYRGDSARTQSGPASGYGIGLSAARSIAEKFHGSLTASYTGNDTIRFFARF